MRPENFLGMLHLGCCLILMRGANKIRRTGNLGTDVPKWRNFEWTLVASLSVRLVMSHSFLARVSLSLDIRGLTSGPRPDEGDDVVVGKPGTDVQGHRL